MLEGVWLLAIMMVPLIYLPDESFHSAKAIAYFEVPKVTLFRTLVGLLSILWLIEWVFADYRDKNTKIDNKLHNPKVLLADLKAWLIYQPSRLIVVAVWALGVGTVVSTICSVSPKVSIWGAVPGQDGYSLYTVMCFVLLFGILVTHVKTRLQLWRILGAIIAMGVTAAGYGIFQHYQNDFLNVTEVSGGGASRITSFMGNAIFAATVFSMTIPATICVAISSIERFKSFLVSGPNALTRWSTLMFLFGIWGTLLAIQMLGLLFTFSRGPWIGTLVSLAVLCLLPSLFRGCRYISRYFILLGLSGLLGISILYYQGSLPSFGLPNYLGWIFALLALATSVFVFLSWNKLIKLYASIGLIAVVGLAILFAVTIFNGNSDSSEGKIEVNTTQEVVLLSQISDRVSSIPGSVKGGLLGGRSIHWATSWDLIENRPWGEDTSFSPIWFRSLIGYGPEIFRYAYLLVSPPIGANALPEEPDHAHNLFIHYAVELGLVGLLALLSLFGSVFWTAWSLLAKSNIVLSGPDKFIIIGLVSIIAGRCVEMMVGVARISDLTIFWVILGTLVSVPCVIRSVGSSSNIPPSPNNNRRRPDPKSRISHSGYRICKLLILVTGILTVGFITWTQSISPLYAGVKAAEAVKLYSRGDLQSSLDTFDKAVNLSSGSSLYNNYRAGVYSTFENNMQIIKEEGCAAQDLVAYQACLAIKAMEANNAALVNQPLYYVPNVALAQFLFDHKDYDGAVALYERSANLVPNSWVILNALGEAYIAAGRPFDAIHVVKKSLDISKDSLVSSAAWLLLGKAYKQTDKTDVMAQALENALIFGADGPERYESVNLLDHAYIVLGAKRAVERYDALIQSHPNLELGPDLNMARNFNEIAEDFEQTNQLDDAAEYYKRTLILGFEGEETDVAFERLAILYRAIDVLDAINGYEEIVLYRSKSDVLVNLDMGDLFNSLASKYYLSGQFEKAAQILEDNLVLDISLPARESAFEMLADIYADLGIDRAIEGYELIRQGRPVKELYTDLYKARFVASTGDIDYASKILEGLPPTNVHPDQRIAKQTKTANEFLENNDWATALQIYENLLRSEPEATPILQARVWLGIGQAQTYMGYHSNALEALAEAGKLGLANKMQSEIDFVTELEKSDSYYAPNVGRTYYDEGDPIKATEYLETTLRIDISDAARAQVFDLLDQLYTILGRERRIEGYWAIVENGSPNSGIQALDNIDEIYSSAPAEFVASSIEANLTPQRANAVQSYDYQLLWSLINDVYDRLGPDRAIRGYQNILANNPTSDRVLDQLVSIYFANGFIQDAKRALDKFSVSLGHDRVTHWELYMNGKEYWLVKDLVPAAASLERSLALNLPEPARSDAFETLHSIYLKLGPDTALEGYLNIHPHSGYICDKWCIGQHADQAAFPGHILWDTKFNKAKYMASIKETDVAISILDGLLQESGLFGQPTDELLVYVMKGDIYRDRLFWGQARESYRLALLIDSGLGEVWKNLALTEISLGYYDDSIESINKAKSLGIDVGYIEAYLKEIKDTGIYHPVALAKDYYQEAKFKDAVDLLELNLMQGLSDGAQDQAFEFLEKLYIERDDIDAAVGGYSSLAEYNIRLEGVIHWYEGLYLLKSRRHELAARSLESGLASGLLGQRTDQAFQILEGIYIKLGLERAVQGYENISLYSGYVCEKYCQGQHPSKASFPGTLLWDTKFNMATFFNKIKENDRALQILNGLLEETGLYGQISDELTIHVKKGDIYTELGWFSEAEASYKLALNISPDDKEILQKLVPLID